MRRTVRILLVDDQLAVRQGLRLWLQLDSEVAVIGEAANALQGLALVADLQPDVVIMDVEMPGIDGITATQMLVGEQLVCLVIVLSIRGDHATRRRALAAGAWAFVEKGRPSDLRVALGMAVESIRATR